MGRQVIRLTESTVHTIIAHTVRKMLSEGIYGNDNNMLLQSIAQEIAKNKSVPCRNGANDCEVELEDGTIVYIDFEVSSSPYMETGAKGADRDVPDDPNEIIDDVEVDNVHIVYYDEADNEVGLEDNGIVKKALEQVLQVEYDYDDIPSKADFYGQDEY